MKNQVFYRNVEVNGLTIFFREAASRLLEEHHEYVAELIDRFISASLK